MNHNWVEAELGNFKVRVIKREDFSRITYDIFLLGDIPGSRAHNPCIKLLASSNKGDGKIYIEDIQGNSYYSDAHRKGAGSLLVNTALLFFKSEFSPDTLVWGELSEVGDPEEEKLKILCNSVREGFWMSFGFELFDGPRDRKRIRARLEELKPKTDGTVFGKIPRYIPLESFKSITKKPEYTSW